jgi:dTDP-4-dehydrorhamnose reductase
MADTMKILVTGSNGQLGSELKTISTSYPSYQFTFLSREEASVTDSTAFKKLFDSSKPAFLINCAAYTAVDKAEEEKDAAFAINGTAVGILAALCKEYNTKLIHISTDYVFDGMASSPLKESDRVNPVNLYGASKLAGEEGAFRKNPDTIIIRTSWVYSFFGKNFVKTMMRLMKEKESINVVSDQLGSPTYAADLAEAIMQIISSGKWVPGIYNYSNEGHITWHDFATEIKRLMQSNCTVNPIPTDAYPTPAKRPKYSVLDKSKIIQTWPIKLKDWKTSLDDCVDKLLRADN